MKLKKILASLTAAAMVVSLTAVTPVMSVDIPDSCGVTLSSFSPNYILGADGKELVIESVPDAAGSTSVTVNMTMITDNYWSNGAIGSSDAGGNWGEKTYQSTNVTGSTSDETVTPGTSFSLTVDTNVTESGETYLKIVEYSNGLLSIDSVEYSNGYTYVPTADRLGTFKSGNQFKVEKAVGAVGSTSVTANMTMLADGSWSNGDIGTNKTADGDWVSTTYKSSSATSQAADVEVQSGSSFSVTLDTYVAEDGSTYLQFTEYSNGTISVDSIEYSNGYVLDADALTASDIEATAVTISPETASVKVGASVQLSAVLEPAGATSTVTWSSDNDSIATVDSTGKVTGVDEGTVTVTASVSDTVKASAVVTVTTNKTVITPVVSLPDSITVYTTDTTEQAKLVKAAAAVSGITGLSSSDYTVTAVSDGAKGTVTFALTTTGSVKYKISDDAVVSASCTINFEQWDPTSYDGYSVSGPMELDVDYNTDAGVISAAVTTAINSQTITLTLIESESDHAPLPAKSLEDVIKSITLPDTYAADSSVSVPVVIDLANVMNEGDVYLGASGEELTELTVTYTVNVGPDTSEPEPAPDPEPDPDPEPAPDPDPEPSPEPDTPSSIGGSFIGGYDPALSYPSNGSTTADSSPYTSGAVSTSAAAGVLRTAGAGDTVTIIMDEDIIPENLLEILADKNNVTAVFVYSGYSVSINSGDIDAAEIGNIDFSNKGRFLTDDELAMFDGAYEVRQLNFAHNGTFPGVSKVTVTVTMRGVSKDKDATVLLRTGEGEFSLVSEGTVGSDRTFSFELTHASKYVVYTGECSVAYAEDISSGAGLGAETEETSSALPAVFAGIAVMAAAAVVIRKIRA